MTGTETELPYIVRNLAGEIMLSDTGTESTQLKVIRDAALRDLLNDGDADTSLYSIIYAGEIMPSDLSLGSLVASSVEENGPIVLEIILQSDSASALNGRRFRYAGYEHEGDRIRNANCAISCYSWKIDAQESADGSIRGCILWYKHASRFHNKAGLDVWEPESVHGSYNSETRALSLRGLRDGLGSGLAVGSYEFTIDETGEEIQLDTQTHCETFMVGRVLDRPVPAPFPSLYAWSAMEVAIRLGLMDRGRIDGNSEVESLAEIFRDAHFFPTSVKLMKFPTLPGRSNTARAVHEQT